MKPAEKSKGCSTPPSESLKHSPCSILVCQSLCKVQLGQSCLVTREWHAPLLWMCLFINKYYFARHEALNTGRKTWRNKHTDTKPNWEALKNIFHVGFVLQFCIMFFMLLLHYMLAAMMWVQTNIKIARFILQAILNVYWRGRGIKVELEYNTHIAIKQV